MSPFFDIQNSNLTLYTSSFHECGQGLLQTRKLPMLWICTVWQRTIQVYSVISSKRQYLQIVNIDLKTRWAYKPSWAPIGYRSSDKWVRSSLITIEQPEPWSMDWRSGLAVYLEARSYRASLYENGNLWSSPACWLVICDTKKIHHRHFFIRGDHGSSSKFSNHWYCLPTAECATQSRDAGEVDQTLSLLRRDWPTRV